MSDDQLNRNIQKGFKGSLSIYAATLINSISGFVISVIMVRGLSQESFGAYKLTGSILLVGTYLCSLGLEKTFVRFGAEFVSRNQLDQLKSILKRFCLLRGIALILFGTFLIIFRQTLSAYFSFPPELKDLISIISLLLFFSSMNGLWGVAFNAAKLDHVHISIIRTTNNLVKMAGFGYIVWVGKGLSGILVVWLFSEIIMNIHFSIINIKWFKRIRVKWSDKISQSNNSAGPVFTKRIARFSLFAYLGININIFKDILVDNFFISHFLDVTSVALYGLASSIVIFIAGFNPPALLRTVFQPILLGQYLDNTGGRGLSDGYSLMTKTSIFCMIPIFSVLLLLADPIIQLVYSPEYLEIIPVMVLLTVFFFFIGLSYSFVPLVNILEKNELYLITGIFSIYNLIMDIILIPRFGIEGAAIATGSSGFFQYLFYWGAFKWYIKMELTFPWPAIWKTLINLIPSILFCLFVKQYISSFIILLIAGLFAGIIYLLMCYFLNIFNEAEIAVFKVAVSK